MTFIGAGLASAPASARSRPHAPRWWPATSAAAANRPPCTSPAWWPAQRRSGSLGAHFAWAGPSNSPPKLRLLGRHPLLRFLPAHHLVRNHLSDHSTSAVRPIGVT